MSNKKNRLDYALSSSDIMEKMDNQTKIIQYGDLVNYKTIDEVFGPYKYIFILYCLKPNSGHWTVLIKLDANNIEFFDSYGSDDVDSELSFIPMEYRVHSNQLHKTLSKLLQKSPYRIHYNDHQMQEFKRGISTCGRHCILRCFNSDKTIDEYFKAMKHNSKKSNCSMDELTVRKVHF
jgi:hypothetical protein